MKTLEELGWEKELDETNLKRFEKDYKSICFTNNEYTDYEFMVFKRNDNGTSDLVIYKRDIEVIRAMLNKLEELNEEK